MARTNLTRRQVQAPYNAANATAVYTKIAEHDTALDALEAGGTTNTSQTHHVDAASTANVANLASFTVSHDGLTMTAGQRILLKDQSTGAQNGIYVLGTVGAGTCALTRATDWDATAEVKSGTLVTVRAGTAGAGRTYKLSNTTAVTVGTTAQTFAEVLDTDHLALTTTGNGADLIGSFDTGGIYTATTVRGQLQEVKAIADAAAPSASLALTTTPGGASYVGVFDNAGIYTATNVEAALAEVKVLADAAIGAVKRTVTVNETALSGASQAVNIGAVLPANAQVFMHEIVVNTQGVLAGNDLTITIGGTDTDAIVASTDLDVLTAGRYQGTLGVHPRGGFGGEQLTATFAASDLATLSAGDWTINVWYFVLA